MKIALVCASGMSTSLLVNNMRKCAGEVDQIDAFSVEAIEEFIDQYDVVLVGPQLRFRFHEIETDIKAYGKPVALLDAKVFGRMDGKAALNLAQAVMNRTD